MPGGGLIFAIGWPGQWGCLFERDDRTGLRIVAGQQNTRLYLKPGEEIRTPLIALFFYEGADTVRAQNLWRRWFMAHNHPRLNGQLVPPMLQMQCYRTFEKGGEKDLFDTVEEFSKAGIPFDLCWRDAGWYPCRGSWPNTGAWEVDRERYPKGFRPFSDWIHQQGKKFIVWFEPERIGDRESWLAKQHPDWILGGNLLNMGHPEAWRWVVEQVDTMVRENGIDYYRQAALYMLGDYYPLTPYSLKPSDWMAWQFDRPDLDGGEVQAFRRDKSDETARTFRLGGLVPKAKYQLSDLDTGPRGTVTGKELMEKGLVVKIESKPGAVVIFYKMVK